MKNIPSKSEDLLDWIDALENLVLFEGKDNAKEIIEEVISHAKNKGLLDELLFSLPFENSISEFEEMPYPGDWDTEEKLDITLGGTRW